MAEQGKAAAVEVKLAPRTFRESLAWLGPGLALAAVLIGSGEAIMSPWIGSQMGMKLLWVIPLAGILKWFLNELVGRYTLLSGETLFEGALRVPGPRGWMAHILMVANAGKITFTYGSMIALTAGIIMYTTGWSRTVCVLIVLGTSILALLTGKFDTVANVMTACVTVMVLFAIYGFFTGVSLIGFPAWLAGLVPSLPEPAKRWLLVGMFSYIGGATSNTLYSWWIYEKDMGVVPLKKAGVPLELTPENESRIRNWMRLMHLDLANGYFWTIAISMIFYTCGAVFLFPKGLSPTGVKAVSTMSQMFHDIGGGFGSALYMAGVVCALWSSISGQYDGSGRVMTDWTRIFFMGGPKRELTEGQKRSIYLVWVVIFCLGGGITSVVAQAPVVLIAIMSMFDLLGYLLGTFGLLWLCIYKVPEKFRLQGGYLAWLVIDLVIFTAYIMWEISRLKWT